MDTDFIFAYDSTMDRSEMRAWLEVNGYDSSLVVNTSPGRLGNYRYVWNFYSSYLGGGKPNLEPSEGDEVFGVIIEFESKLLKAFDRREGNPFIYSRGEVRVPVRKLQNEEIIQCWLYMAQPNRSGRLDVYPTRDYKKIITQAAGFWGFPEDYSSKLASWRSV